MFSLSKQIELVQDGVRNKRSAYMKHNTHADRQILYKNTSYTQSSKRSGVTESRWTVLYRTIKTRIQNTQTLPHT